jgi:hypothetical protein
MNGIWDPNSLNNKIMENKVKGGLADGKSIKDLVKAPR